MRKFFFGLFVLLTATVSFGQVVNPRIYNIEDFPGYVNGKPCDDAARAALAKITADAVGDTWGGAILQFGNNKYYVNETIHIDQSNVRVKGAGRGATQVTKSGCAGPTFLFGLAEFPQGKALSADHWLATTLTGMPTGWRAYRSLGDTEMDFWAGTLSSPPTGNWSATPVVTFDLAWRQSPGTSPGTGPDFGMGDYRGPRPISIYENGSFWYVSFKTDDGVNRLVSFPDPNTRSVDQRRVTVQLDMTNAVCLGWVDDVQMQVTPQSNATPDVWLKGMKLARNDTFPFQFGNKNAFMGSPAAMRDFITDGFAAVNKARYVDGGVGSTISRIDLAPVANATRYTQTADWLNTLGALALNRTEINRHVHAQSSTAGLLHGNITAESLQVSGNFQIGHNSIEDMTLIGLHAGQPVCVANCLDFEAKRLLIAGGWDNIGRAPVGGAWPVRLEDIEGIYAISSTISMPDTIGAAKKITAKYYGEQAIQLEGGQFSVTDLFSTAPSGGEYVARITAFDEGGNYNFSDWSVDTEGDAFPTKGAIFIEAGNRRPTQLTLKNLNWGSLKKEGVFIDMKESSTGTGSVYVSDSVVYSPQYTAYARTSGSHWTCKFERFNGGTVTQPTIGSGITIIP